jgi:hypothetical protein
MIPSPVWSPSLSRDEAGLQISEIAGTQLLHSDRLVIELAIFDRIITPSDPTELHPFLSACRFWCPSNGTILASTRKDSITGISRFRLYISYTHPKREMTLL